MGLRSTFRRLPLAGAAVAGAAVGHSIAYLIVAPEGRTRAALLAGTGHGYWSTAVAAEIVLGVLALVTFLARHFSRGLRAQKRPPGDEPWARLAARLGLFQVTIFVVQEVVERAIAGHPVADLVSDRLLSIGILVQLGVAILAAMLLVWLGRAAEAVGRALGQSPQPRPAGVPVARPPLAVRAVWRSRGAYGIRGPPLTGTV
jgi:hypothetical protein